jgi:uncharacterized protein (DUF488 family)
MSLDRLLTIGYEAADAKDFLATVKMLGVTTLLDVRELAMSRRAGFAKTALRNGLTSIGVHYWHEPRLGSPKPIRDQLREDGDYRRFFRDFGRYLNSQAALLQSVVDELDGTVALLCYERDAQTCHRRAVADAISELTGLKPQHKGVQCHAQREAFARHRPHLGEGIPAT